MAYQALLVEKLSQAGYSVETAATGRDAVAMCDRRPYDAITLDLILPDMSGLDALAAIRAGGPSCHAPVVIVTIVAEKVAAAAFSVVDVLHKPVDMQALLGSLQRAGVRPGLTGNVLVVDDDPKSLKLMEAAVAQLGLTPVCRDSGESALAAVGDTPPVAVVLDLLMPGMDGFEFLERFRRTPAGRRAPVIIWTGKDVTATDRARLRSAAQAVVQKSGAGMTSLLEELRALLQGEAT